MRERGKGGLIKKRRKGKGSGKVEKEESVV